MDRHDDLTNRLVALTRDLMLIRSTERYPEEREHCFDFICNHLEAIDGITLRNYESNGYSSLVMLPVGVDEPEILFCGHIDVIEHPDVERYGGMVRDGRIYGPGSGDMKGQVAIILELFRHLQAEQPGISIGVALTSDEERGGEDGVRFLFEEQGLRCKAAIIPDGGSLNRVTVEEKGILHVRLRCHGHAGHAARPWLAENALQRMSNRLTDLDRYFEGLKDEARSNPPPGNDHWYPTCELTMLETQNRTINRIPGEAEAIMDVRFPPPYTSDQMIDTLAKVLGSEIEVVPIIRAEPTHLAPDPLFQEVTEEVTGEPAALVQVSGGSDARFICQYSIPVMLSRPFVGNLHAADEWIDIDSMLTYYRICEAYVRKKLS